jgi:hypothetical protein
MKGVNQSMGPYRVPAMLSTQNQHGNLQNQGTSSKHKVSKWNN